MTKLSIIIPTFRRPTALRLVLQSFLSQHRELLRSHETELIIVEAAPIAETARVIDEVRVEYSELPVQLLHHTTKSFGYISKLIEGFEHATGDYVLTLTDEDFSHSDYLTPILAQAREGSVYPVLFTGSLLVRRVYASGYPSHYRHGVPAFAHFVSSSALFGQLINDVGDYRHYVTDHHIPLLCWERGLMVVFMADFLRHPPVLHMDSDHEGPPPPGPPPDFREVSRVDRRLFRRNWPLDRKRAAVQKMAAAIATVAAGRRPGLGVVCCRDEYFIVDLAATGAQYVAPYYSWIEAPIDPDILSALSAEERLSKPPWSVEIEDTTASVQPSRAKFGTRVLRRLRAMRDRAAT